MSPLLERAKAQPSSWATDLIIAAVTAAALFAAFVINF